MWWGRVPEARPQQQAHFFRLRSFGRAAMTFVKEYGKDVKPFPQIAPRTLQPQPLGALWSVCQLWEGAAVFTLIAYPASGNCEHCFFEGYNPCSLISHIFHSDQDFLKSAAYGSRHLALLVMGFLGNMLCQFLNMITHRAWVRHPQQTKIGLRFPKSC